MKILAIERYGDFDIPYLVLFKGSDESPEPSVVLAELEAINEPTWLEQEKLHNQMVRILTSHGYAKFEPPMVTISD